MTTTLTEAEKMGAPSQDEIAAYQQESAAAQMAQVRASAKVADRDARSRLAARPRESPMSEQHCCACCAQEDSVEMFAQAIAAAGTVYDLNRPGEALDAATELLVAAFKIQTTQVAIQRKALSATDALPEFPK